LLSVSHAELILKELGNPFLALKLVQVSNFTHKVAMNGKTMVKKKKKMFFMKLHEILYDLNKSDFSRTFGLSGIPHARWKELETQFSSAKNQLGVLTLSTKLRIAQ
jgi:hypothetical protein